MKNNKVIQHPSSTIVIKRAKIDKDIQPVVKWLNSFPSVFTRWCCEGYEESNEPPYVVFYCDSQKELNEILTAVCSYAQVGVEFYQERMIRYTLKFNSRGWFNGFVDQKGL